MATFYIAMTSGIEGPETSLTEEQIQKIEELASQLNQPWIGDKNFGMGLGPANYTISDAGNICGLRVLPEGFVSVWKTNDTDWHDFVDTVGLWAYLAPIGSVTLQKWLQECQKQMDEYNENMLRPTE